MRRSSAGHHAKSMQPQPTLPASCWRADVDHFGQGLESGAASECIGNIEFIAIGTDMVDPMQAGLMDLINKDIKMVI